LKSEGYKKDTAKVTDVSKSMFLSKFASFMIRLADFQKIFIRSIEFQKKDDKITFMAIFMESKKFLNLGTPEMSVILSVMSKDLKMSNTLEFKFKSDRNAVSEFKSQNIGPKLKMLYKSVK
jgi:hypothetical protein